MMFNDPEVQQLAPNDISLGVYTDHQVDILGKCNFFMIHPDTKEATCSDIFMLPAMKAVCYYHAQLSLH